MKKVNKVYGAALAGLLALGAAVPFGSAQSPAQSGDGQQPAPRAEGHRFGHGRGDWGGGAGFGRGFAKLNLTDAQKAQMKQIAQSSRERLKPLHEQLRAKEAELRQAGEGGNFNEAVAAQKLAELAPLRAKLMAEQFKVHQEMQAVLTAEQKAQLEQQRQEMKTRREQFRSKRAKGAAGQTT